MPDAGFLVRHHDHGGTGSELVVTVGGTDVAHYVYRPDTPVKESPKPYFHPLRTLSGAPLTVYRPWDHRWHKGLQMTWSHVSGDNFWGGPSYQRDRGYVWRRNHGSQLHRTFDSYGTGGTDVHVRQRLDWIAASGVRWFDETRTLHFHSADPVRGIWALDFGTDLANVRTAPLKLGSPTTHGRELAGYTGLFWRGPRSWTGGDIIAAGGRGGEALMGTRADWAAFAGDHDEIDAGGTVLAYSGTSSAQVPLTWFARSTQFAALNPSPAFAEEITLEPGGTLRLRHRFVFVDRRLDRAALEPLAAEFAL